jgi:sulfatase maturation enzyme AslB (radical SAM superfamily)
VRAQNLTISIPPADKLCDKNCPYCVSRMTGYMKPNWDLIERNVMKVQYLAKAAQVTSVLFTGKGEPTLNEEALYWLMGWFEEMPMELQTNGVKLSKDFAMLDHLAELHLDTLAVSVDDLATFVNYYELFARSKELDLVTRVTLNITNKLPKDINFEWLVNLCKETYIDQLMLRNVVVPNNAVHSPETRKWINENVDTRMYPRLQDELKRACERDGMMLRILNFGSVVYDYKGVAVTYSDYCVQDNNNGKDIRSLIFMEDGHCYTSWNSKASILF